MASHGSAELRHLIVKSGAGKRTAATLATKRTGRYVTLDSHFDRSVEDASDEAQPAEGEMTADLLQRHQRNEHLRVMESIGGSCSGSAVQTSRAVPPSQLRTLGGEPDYEK